MSTRVVASCVSILLTENRGSRPESHVSANGKFVEDETVIKDAASSMYAGEWLAVTSDMLYIE